MANVFNVARYVLRKCGPMSTWKLQKLCYYCQAWSIAWTERPLFDDEFEAWTNGPVCRTLFNQHKGKFVVSPEEIPAWLQDSADLTEDQIDTIDHVLEHYGACEPYELREQTHSEDPWILARGDLPDDVPCNSIISKESMGNYYGGL
mgnify:CR=1 FL=1